VPNPLVRRPSAGPVVPFTIASRVSLHACSPEWMGPAADVLSR
jgi:hypothetical protein